MSYKIHYMYVFTYAMLPPPALAGQLKIQGNKLSLAGVLATKYTSMNMFHHHHYGGQVHLK